VSFTVIFGRLSFGTGSGEMRAQMEKKHTEQNDGSIGGRISACMACRANLGGVERLGAATMQTRCIVRASSVSVVDKSPSIDNLSTAAADDGARAGLGSHSLATDGVGVRSGPCSGI